MENITDTNKTSTLQMYNQESRQLTRECIQTALLRLLQGRTFEKITVTSIIKLSGVSRAGFYRNYASKEDVLQEIVYSAYERLTEFITAEKYKNNTYQWYLDLFQAAHDNSELFKLLIQAKVPHEYIFHAESFFQQLFAHQTAKERYRTIAVGNALKEIILDWFSHGMKESPEEMASLFMEMFH